jgi:hypothetical protein
MRVQPSLRAARSKREEQSRDMPCEILARRKKSNQKSVQFVDRILNRVTG